MARGQTLPQLRALRLAINNNNNNTTTRTLSSITKKTTTNTDTTTPTTKPTRASKSKSTPSTTATASQTTDDDKTTQQNLALTHALKKIDSLFGKGTIMKMGEKVTIRGDVQVIPTGSLSLDEALGVGGLAIGRIVEIFGPEASGKTSLALSVIGQAQKMGGKCVFVDAEHALDPKFAKAMGVNVDELMITQPDSGEQALEITDTLVRSGSVKVIVIDSVAALVPRAELEGEMGDAHMGMQARLMSQALRKLTGSVNKSGTLLIFINQIRNKLGVVFGNPEVTSGGQALKFYASIRLDVRRAEFIKEDGIQVGTVQKVKVVKNKLAPPFGVAQFSMKFGKGIDRVQEMVDVGLKRGVVELKGNTYSFLHPDKENERVIIGVGRGKALKALETDVELHAQLFKKLADEMLKNPQVNVELEIDENSVAATTGAAGTSGAGGSGDNEEVVEDEVGNKVVSSSSPNGKVNNEATRL